VRRLGNSLQSAGDPDEIGQRLARTTRHGMNATWVRVWAPPASPVPAGGQAPLAVSGPDADSAVPVLVAEMPGGGRIECGRRRGGDYRPEDAELLATLARQAGPAVANARLTAELAASRARLVQAETEQRRRIERDIHDGVQQQLVALMSRLTVARVQLARDPLLAAASLEEMQEDFRQAVADLRDLASGIHPAVLTDSGLLAAVEARAGRMPLGVSIHWEAGPPGRRFDPDVESAAYFVLSEALANVLKHAGAHAVDVRICATDARLELEVRDDGKGFDPQTVTSRGLLGLRDRMEALGGELLVVSSPGAGTCLRGHLPVGCADQGAGDG
jgi:signal transduction histidine kinase